MKSIKETIRKKGLILDLSEPFYKHLIKLSPDAIVIHEDGKILYVNQAGIKMIKAKKAADLIGKPIIRFIHDSSRVIVRERIRKRLMRRKMTKPIEEKFIRFDKTTLDAEVTSLPFIYKKKLAILSVIRDLTFRKKTELELSKLANVAQNTADPVFITDRKGKFSYINSAFLKITGFTREEIIGKTPRIIKSGRHTILFYKKLWQKITSGQAFRAIMVNKKKNGELFYVDHTITPIKNKSGEITDFVGIWKDITAQQELEKRKNDFISIASHELKTPLTSISLYSQALSAILTKENNNTYVRYIEKINTQVDRLNNLINSLLDISKAQAGKIISKRDLIDPYYLIKETIETIKAISGNHEIIFVGKANPKIYCDQERINQVMINLLSNAIKYSPDGGKIVVKMIRKPKDLIVSVRDQGIGIPRIYQNKIFERFSRARISKYANYPGMGISLYLSSEIIKQHGGNMWVESDGKSGSTFYFSLPIQTN